MQPEDPEALGWYAQALRCMEDRKLEPQLKSHGSCCPSNTAAYSGLLHDLVSCATREVVREEEGFGREHCHD